MATNTPNLNLSKPDLSDKMKDTVTALASNMDELDSSFGDKTVNLKTTAKSVIPALNEHDDKIGTLSGLNTHSLQTTYDANNRLTQAKELDLIGNTVSETDITYNADGTVNTMTEIINGKTMMTTLNYVNGSLSTTNPYTRSVS